MAHHNVYTYFSVHNCLDEEFDALDIAADRQLCQAIVAGRMGLHPNAWSNHDPLTMPPLRYRRPFVSPVGYPADNAVEWKPHTPRPQKPQKPRRPAWHWVAPADRYRPEPSSYGTLQLTCDVCDRARFGGFVSYHGDRPARVAEIRRLGHEEGWTCIAGTDRCPTCSQAAAVKPVGNGAGGNQGDEQHA